MADKPKLDQNGLLKPPKEERMTAYCWWVLFIGAASWLFDCMDQRIFVLSRAPAIQELIAEKIGELSKSDAASMVANYGRYVTAAMVVGWAVGGLFFGIVGDKWGRVRTLSTSIFVYSIFTGLSGLSQSWWDFCLWRFLMGCGIGGAFATAATLIAETMPSRYRALALGSFQALSATGNILGSAIARWWLLPDVAHKAFGMEVSGWRLLFFIGILPALLIVLIMKTIKEPATWDAAKASAKDQIDRQLGDLSSMMRHRRWRRNVICGVLLSIAGVVGLWGIGFWTPELIKDGLSEQSVVLESIYTNQYQEVLGLPDEETTGTQPAAVEQARAKLSEKVLNKLDKMLAKDAETIKENCAAWQKKSLEGDALREAVGEEVKDHNNKYAGEVVALATLFQDCGAFFGMFFFTLLALWLGRKISFGFCFILCYIVVGFVFLSLRTESQAYWMAPMVGFATLSVFGGYAVYFPELFPTRLRATGTGICYNVGRILSAAIIFIGTPIQNSVKGVVENNAEALSKVGVTSPFRAVAIIMCSIYVIGLIALIWAPETKGKPLPTDDDVESA